MNKRKKNTYSLNPLLILVNFFIQIGYIAKLIIKSPFLLITKVFKQISSISIKVPVLKLPSRTSKKVATSHRKFRFIVAKPSIKLPKITIPQIKIHFPKLSFPRFKINFPKPQFPGFSNYSPFLFKTKYFFLGIFSLLVILGIYQGYNFVNELPSPKSIGKLNYPLSTHIIDRKGKLLYEIYRDQNRTPVELTNLPPYIYEATIAFEDKDFFHHNGVSITGAIRAAREIGLKNNLQGGSTITQQLVKSALLSPERTIERKIKEIILAIWTERLYSKKEILEMYLNQVPYGGSSYGIEEAAQTYFNKEAKNLRLEEAALLAGLPQAPSVYAPYVNPELALKRRNEILRKMNEQGYITKDQMINAQKTKLHAINPKTNIRAPHFVFYIKSILEKLYGIREVEEGGLKVTTSLDLDLQEQTEQTLKEELDKIKNLNVTNGAILVTKPQTGEILAMVGSYDYFAAPSGAYNVVTAHRQPGSSIKPLMYALALSGSYTPASVINDSPTVFGAPGAQPYSPVNYDGRFHGNVPLRYALANSYNIPAVKVLNTLGVENFVNHAKKMGISTWDDSSGFGLSLTLGGGEVTMIDMSTAFGIFANNGDKTPVIGITKIEDYRGNVLFEYKPEKERVLDPGVAYQISDILSDNVARQQAFGAKSALEIPNHKVAVKTGTTDSKKDNWTIGYTPSYLTAVWVGNNDNTPMNQALVSGITGAAPIWNRVMTDILKKPQEKVWFEKPSNIVERSCYGGRVEYFIEGHEGGGCGTVPFKTTPAQNSTPARPTIR